jgi:hypothetical protein
VSATESGDHVSFSMHRGPWRLADAAAWFSSWELPPDRREVVPDGLPDDPAVADLQEPEHAVTQSPPVTIDLEGPAGQTALPDVLVEDEVVAVQPSSGNVALMDRGRQLVAIPAPDSLEALDRVASRADLVVDDGIGHLSEDPVDIAVVLRAQLVFNKPIEVDPPVINTIFLGLHRLDDDPTR